MRERTRSISPDKGISCRIFPDNWLGPINIPEIFPRIQPLEIDIGCGKGRFLLARASSNPEINYLGIDRMLRRIRKVDRKAVRAGLNNVRLLRAEAYYAVSYLIPENSVSSYYIFFPDPWPKKKHHDHRLFNETFTDALHRTLKAGGHIHFSSDHSPYFNEVYKHIGRDPRFREIPAFIPSPEERTDFEIIFEQKANISRVSLEKL